tara:strand:+ start:5195 stop:5302 length:108 start_codon:yes stop_codon:yes gene_type:complete
VETLRERNPLEQDINVQRAEKEIILLDVWRVEIGD